MATLVVQLCTGLYWALMGGVPTTHSNFFFNYKISELGVTKLNVKKACRFFKRANLIFSNTPAVALSDKGPGTLPEK
jgi:hypothetical protein